MSEKFFNNVAGELASGIGTGDTSITLASGHNFVDPGSGNFYRATLHQDEANYEIVNVTALATDTVTVERAKEGTTAKSYNAGDPIEHRWTAGAATQAASGGGANLSTLIWLGV